MDLGSARTPCATPPDTGNAAREHWSPTAGSGGPTDAFDGYFTVTGKALQNFEAFYNMEPGAATLRQVENSSAGVKGWAAAGGANQHPHGFTIPLETQTELWVTKWVDYSSKYGLGYMMSDGAIGVYFNDSTKVILSPDGNQFDYVTRRTQERPETRTVHTFDNFPQDLKKKVTLLVHYRNYMVTDVAENKDGVTMGESSLVSLAQRTLRTYETQEVPYVKKWVRNKHAILFQLSNKVVQVLFFDKTEVVLSSPKSQVMYVDKRGQVSTYPMKAILDVANAELAKRVRYIKAILVNLLGSRTNDLVPQCDCFVSSEGNVMVGSSEETAEIRVHTASGQEATLCVSSDEAVASINNKVSQEVIVATAAMTRKDISGKEVRVVIENNHEDRMNLSNECRDNVWVHTMDGDWSIVEFEDSEDFELILASECLA